MSIQIPSKFKFKKSNRNIEDDITLQIGKMYDDLYVAINNLYTAISILPEYADNDAAIAGGLIAGQLYRIGDDPDVVCIVH